jgi:uncharacterized membrane protein
MNKYDILDFILILAIMFCFIQIHEFTHINVYNKYSCENIEYHVTWTSALCTDTGVIGAQAQVENIGYQVLLPLALIFVVLLVKD